MKTPQDQFVGIYPVKRNLIDYRVTEILSFRRTNKDRTTLYYRFLYLKEKRKESQDIQKRKRVHQFKENYK